MARQAPTYAAHIAKIRQQALEETAAEQERLRGQLGRVEAEMRRLQACCDADRQATKDLMEVEKIQVFSVVCMVMFMCLNQDVFDVWGELAMCNAFCMRIEEGPIGYLSPISC